MLQRDDLAVTLLLFFSGLLAPSVELLIGDAAGLDPREALFILLAIRLEDGVVGLLFRPLPERADLAAALLTVLYRALAVLRGNQRPQFLQRRTVTPRSTQLRSE